MTNIKLENLEIDGYHLYQDKNNFNFGIDAVLLANFVLREYPIGARITRPYSESSTSTRPYGEGSTSTRPYGEGSTSTRPHDDGIKICDLCSGTLPIPLIIYAKTTSPKLHIDAFEIDKDQVALSNKSILWNKENVKTAKNIDKDISVFNEDIKNIFLDKDKYKKLYESYDIVTVNPPYNKKGSGLVNLNDKIIAARHEITITFDEICKVANLILKSNKKLYIINQTNRFTEVAETLKKHSFEIKKAAFIHPYIDKPSNLFIIEAVKSGRAGIKILPPIVVYEKTNVYTESILKIYGK